MVSDLVAADESPDPRGYVGLLLRSGFPEPALRLGAAARRRWLESYVERLLANLLVIESIPAWTSNRLERLVLSPKRYVIDPAIATRQSRTASV